MDPKRRKILLYAALGVIVLALAWPMWNRFNDGYHRARTQAVQAQLRLDQAIALHERVLADRTASNSLERIVSSRRTTFDLYTYVNEQVQKHASDEEVKLTSRGATSSGRAMQAVNVDFRNVQVRILMTVIHEIYAGRNLVVLERLHHMRPGKAGYGIDCEMTLIAPQ